MVDRCLLRIRPPDFQDILPSLDEYSAWEPCADPVTFAAREPYAPGGWLLLCQKHYLALKEAPKVVPSWQK